MSFDKSLLYHEKIIFILFFLHSFQGFSQSFPIDINFDLKKIKTTTLGLSDFIESIQNVFIDSKFVIIASMEKVLYFDFQGRFVKKVSFPIDDRKVETYFNKQFLRMAESFIFRDTAFYVYNIYNQMGDLVKESIKSIPVRLKKDSNGEFVIKKKK